MATKKEAANFNEPEVCLVRIMLVTIDVPGQPAKQFDWTVSDGC